MPLKTMRRKSVKNVSRKNRKSLSSLEQDVALYFLEMLNTVKLYHWKTHSYATHKATDDLYGKLNGHVDSFIEVLLGKTNNRINLTSRKSIRLVDLTSQETLKKRIEEFKSYLINLSNNKSMKLMSNTDLLNIRDEILADLNQFLYLLSFK